jgi:hemerythrin-like domain-containing protein
MAIATELKSKIIATTTAAKATLNGEVGIYRRLKAEHAEVLSLIQAAEAATDAATRTDLFATVRRQLTTHIEAEEKEFYALLSQYPATKEYTQINVDEHRALEAILTTLQHIEPMCAEWGELFGKLKALLISHVEREERELFEASKDLISSQEAKVIEVRFSEGKAEEAKRFDGDDQEVSRYVIPIP